MWQARSEFAKGARSFDAAEEPVGFAAFAFGRPARTAITTRHGGEDFSRRRGRAAVDQALRGDRSAHSFGDDALDDHDAFDTADPDADLVARADGLGGFGRDAIDADMSTSTGFSSS